MIDVSTLTANELVSKLRSGEISSVELCNKYLDRIKKYEKDIQAWAHLDKKILLEKEILDYKNILIGQQSEQKILKLEENLAALNSKTEIQNQKLSTAIDMIENLQLERINLLSKLNFSNSNDEQLALQN